MATVLVSVALVAASIWIAIRMESGLDSPAARALPADTGPMRPARCRFRHPGTRPAARPVRCTQRSPQGRPRLHHPFPPGQGADRDHDRGQAPGHRAAGSPQGGRADHHRPGPLDRQPHPARDGASGHRAQPDGPRAHRQSMSRRPERPVVAAFTGRAWPRTTARCPPWDRQRRPDRSPTTRPSRPMRRATSATRWRWSSPRILTRPGRGRGRAGRVRAPARRRRPGGRARRRRPACARRPGHQPRLHLSFSGGDYAAARHRAKVLVSRRSVQQR